MSSDAKKRHLYAVASAATASLLGVAAYALTKTLRQLDIHVGPKIAAGRIIVFIDQDTAQEPIRMLAVGGAIQSGTYLGANRYCVPFLYLRSFDCIFDGDAKISNVLMLGGGAFAWPKHALYEHDELCIDVVEPESAIVATARRWFYLDELEKHANERLRIYTSEGLTFLKTCVQKYDVIINDAFEGFSAVATLFSHEAIELVYTHLHAGGKYLINVVCGPNTTKLEELMSKLEQHSFEVSCKYTTDEQLSDDDNYLVIATKPTYSKT